MKRKPEGMGREARREARDQGERRVDRTHRGP